MHRDFKEQERPVFLEYMSAHQNQLNYKHNERLCITVLMNMTCAHCVYSGAEAHPMMSMI